MLHVVGRFQHKKTANAPASAADILVKEERKRRKVNEQCQSRRKPYWCRSGAPCTCSVKGKLKARVQKAKLRASPDRRRSSERGLQSADDSSETRRTAPGRNTSATTTINNHKTYAQWAQQATAFCFHKDASRTNNFFVGGNDPALSGSRRLSHLVSVNDSTFPSWASVMCRPERCATRWAARHNKPKSQMLSLHVSCGHQTLHTFNMCQANVSNVCWQIKVNNTTEKPVRANSLNLSHDHHTRTQHCVDTWWSNQTRKRWMNDDNVGGRKKECVNGDLGELGRKGRLGQRPDNDKSSPQRYIQQWYLQSVPESRTLHRYHPPPSDGRQASACRRKLPGNRESATGHSMSDNRDISEIENSVFCIPAEKIRSNHHGDVHNIQRYASIGNKIEQW